MRMKTAVNAQLIIARHVDCSFVLWCCLWVSWRTQCLFCWSSLPA